jgi:Ni,Fe-hydrogenase maturation factor
LSQTNFLPDLTQVNFLLETIEVEPALVQVAPALTAPIAGEVSKELKKAIETTRARVFFMAKMLLSHIGFVSTFF